MNELREESDKNLSLQPLAHLNPFPTHFISTNFETIQKPHKSKHSTSKLQSIWSCFPKTSHLLHEVQRTSAYSTYFY